MLPTVTGDTKAIIGTIVGTGLVVAGLLSAQLTGQFAAVNARIDDLRTDLTTQIAAVNTRIDDVNNRIDDMADRMDRVETRLDGFDERLRNVEIAFGKVDQRLLTLERILLPPREPAGG